MRSHQILDPIDNKVAGFTPYVEAAIIAPNFQSKSESIYRILVRSSLGQDSRLVGMFFSRLLEEMGDDCLELTRIANWYMNFRRTGHIGLFNKAGCPTFEADMLERVEKAGLIDFYLNLRCQKEIQYILQQQQR